MLFLQPLTHSAGVMLSQPVITKTAVITQTAIKQYVHQHYSSLQQCTTSLVIILRQRCSCSSVILWHSSSDNFHFTRFRCFVLQLQSTSNSSTKT